MCPATKTIALSAEAATCLPGVRFDVPVEDAADKGGDEGASELCGGDGLRHREHEREVAGYALLLQHLRRRVTAGRRRLNAHAQQ